MLPFLILFFHTVFLWICVLTLHKYKYKITLIPLYAFISALTILTHVTSSFGLSLNFLNYFFLIASTAYFTPLLLSIFVLYLFDGIHATRKAVQIILGISALLILTIFLVSLEDGVNVFIKSTFSTYKEYFWSIFAMVVDTLVISIGWELFSKIKRVPNFVLVTLLLFLALSIDTFIFATGVFGTQPFYFSMIKANLTIRAFMSLIMGAVLSRYLRVEHFSEEKRVKPEQIWDIVNFKSEDEQQIQYLEETIVNKNKIQKELQNAKDLYQMVLDGVDTGIWIYNISSGTIEWSDKAYNLLGYSQNERPDINVKDFFKLTHPDDTLKIQAALDKHFLDKVPYHVEYRLKLKSGDYKWFSANGVTQFDLNGKPLKMVGSLIDINERKIYEKELREKLQDLENINKMMVDRELKMIELKNQLEKNSRV